jgi:hypothetical protein
VKQQPQSEVIVKQRKPPVGKTTNKISTSMFAKQSIISPHEITLEEDRGEFELSGFAPVKVASKSSLKSTSLHFGWLDISEHDYIVSRMKVLQNVCTTQNLGSEV